jgi:hypothetical protein
MQMQTDDSKTIEDHATFSIVLLRAINSSRAQSDLECFSTDKFISHKQCVAMTGALPQSVILQDHSATINAH